MTKPINIILRQAIKKADVKLVEKAIADDADVNAKGPKGISPLHEAIILESNLAGRDGDKFRAYCRIVDLLIKHGADVNAKADDLSRPLHLAATGMSQNTIIIDSLIRNGAEINAKDKWGNTPLHLASAVGRDGTASALVRAGADTTIPDGIGRTAEGIWNENTQRIFHPSEEAGTGFAGKEQKKVRKGRSHG